MTDYQSLIAQIKLVEVQWEIAERDRDAASKVYNNLCDQRDRMDRIHYERYQLAQQSMHTHREHLQKYESSIKAERAALQSMLNTQTLTSQLAATEHLTPSYVSSIQEKYQQAQRVHDQRHADLFNQHNAIQHIVQELYEQYIQESIKLLR